MRTFVLKALPVAIVILYATQVTAGPVVYGKMNVTTHMNSGDVEVDNIDQEGTDKDFNELSSNASRFGIKGKTRLTETLDAIYKVEFEIAVDDGVADDKEKDELKARNTYVGIQGNWGTLIAGKHDTPVKLAQNKIDLFNDLPLGDIKNTFVGENRENNIIIYTTPRMKGFSASVAMMPGEENDDSDEDNNGDKDNGLTDGISYSLSYQADNLYLAIAGDEDVANTDIIRVVGQYEFRNITLGIMWQDAEEAKEGIGIGSVSGPLKDIKSVLGEFEEQDGYMLSAKVKLNDKWALRAQWAESDVEGIDGITDAETEQIALGLDYLFSKETKLFGYYSLLEADGDNGVSKVDVEFDTFAVGMEHKF